MLCDAGAHVVMACRSAERAKGAMAEVTKNGGKADIMGEASLMEKSGSYYELSAQPSSRSFFFFLLGLRTSVCQPEMMKTTGSERINPPSLPFPPHLPDIHHPRDFLPPIELWVITASVSSLPPGTAPRKTLQSHSTFTRV